MFKECSFCQPCPQGAFSVLALELFASLNSLSKIILFEKYYQAFDTVFHHQI